MAAVRASARGPRRVPTGGDYVAALQDTALCFRDPELRGASVHTDALGRPRPYSGTFASVFRVTSASGRRYALKCFTRDVPDREARYRAIARRLAAVRGSWKVGFDYLPAAMLVGGGWHPLVRMEWVEATGLLPWIEAHLGDPRAMTEMAARFASLAADLEDAGLAHGDLQHGNLLVSGDGTLRLIDYDGMYARGVPGRSAVELGHRNYQSPRRSAADLGPRLDRFSAWVIYASLVAVAADPALWERLHEPGGEHLLLTAEDFADPRRSSRFPVLLAHPDPAVRGPARRVRDLSGVPLRKVPRLEPVTRGRLTSTTRPAVAAPGPFPAAVPPPAPAASPSALPAWMAGYVSPRQPAQSSTQPAPAAAAARPAPSRGPASTRPGRWGVPWVLPRVLPRPPVIPVRLVPLAVFGVLPAAVRTAIGGATGLAGGAGQALLRYRCRPRIRPAAARPGPATP